MEAFNQAGVPAEAMFWWLVGMVSLLAIYVGATIALSRSGRGQ